MIVRNFFLNLVLAGALLVAPALAAAQTTQLPNLHYMSGWLNFTRGQAVSLNFTNIDRVTRNVSLNFVDMNGTLLKTAAGNVLPGQTVSISFSFTELGRTSSTRVGIRGVAVLATPPEPDAPPSPDLGLASLEIFDMQSSKTLIGLLLPAVRNANVFFPTDQ